MNGQCYDKSSINISAYEWKNIPSREPCSLFWLKWVAQRRKSSRRFVYCLSKEKLFEEQSLTGHTSLYKRFEYLTMNLVSCARASWLCLVPKRQRILRNERENGGAVLAGMGAERETFLSATVHTPRTTFD